MGAAIPVRITKVTANSTLIVPKMLRVKKMAPIAMIFKSHVQKAPQLAPHAARQAGCGARKIFEGLLFGCEKSSGLR